MQVDNKRPFISLFSGYPHLFGDPQRLQVDFDEHYSRFNPAPDEPEDAPPLAKPPAPDELEVGAPKHPPELSPDPWPLMGHLHRVPDSPLARSPHQDLPTKPAVPDPISHSSGGGGGGGVVGSHGGVRHLVTIRSTHISVDEQHGDSQLDLRVTQVNVGQDNDIVVRQDNDIVTDGSGAPFPLYPVDNLADVVSMAKEQVPVFFAGPHDTPQEVVATLREHGDGPQADAPIQTLAEGIVRDGHAVGSGAPPLPDPALKVPISPTDNDANMAVVHTGGNMVTNVATLIDGQGPVGTLVVLGDSYKSNAIVQTNVLVDHSAVAGTAETALVQTGDNAANNVAELVRQFDGNPYEMGFFGGLRWHVDRIDGDFYDVKMVKQVNWLSDNDCVQQTATDHYKFMSTGENGLGNDLWATQFGTQYDLVIVNGNYFAANWIFQTNILLNSDYVLIQAGQDGAGQETVSTGGNWLLNTALIADYSGGAHPLTADMQHVVDALQSGEPVLDPSLGHLVPGNGSMDLNVLFITGNYYDLNVLQQTNVVSDSDIVVQSLDKGEAGYVSTGGNFVGNDANIVKLGPLGGEYVAGNEYSESVLVQTNIIAQSADVVPAQSGPPPATDPNAAPQGEAAAVPASEQSAVVPPTEMAAHAMSDPLNSVLS
jgi:hypothetical protein